MRKPEKQVRGAALVSKVLDVTVDEMMRADFGTLSMESIAAAAGVNKTTMYRRWGSLENLVREAGQRLLATLSPPCDLGGLLADLQHYYRGVRALLIAVRLRGGGRIQLDPTAPQGLEEIRQEFEKQKLEELREIFRRAVARGEVPKRVDLELIAHVLAGAVMQLTLFSPAGCDDAKVDEVIELVLHGVPSYAPRKARQPGQSRRSKQ